ncbi:hypothetical protein TrST_g1831 [Triparma strigata]|uniref:RING-CH-type domain-containing protein n=1 Tax=Triparma strigata TaxID=1606541 RepID=A0A9W7BX81_9STRA|nr:hypothetical protein TrST_g1831 [Triparma strigata]
MASEDLRTLRLRRFGGDGNTRSIQKAHPPINESTNDDSDGDSELSVEDIFADDSCSVPIHLPSSSSSSSTPLSPLSPFSTTPTSPAHPTPNFEGPPTCRICFMDNSDPDSSSSGPLISPCHCRGTQKYVHLTCLNHWRRQNPLALRQCQTCGYQYNIARSKLSIFICDPHTIYSVAVLLLFLATISLGVLCTKITKQFNQHMYASSFIYSLARYNRRNFHPWLQNDFFDSFVVGCFIIGAYFCLRHLRSQLSIILEMRDERQLGLFALWCASLANNPAFASRTAIIIGTAIAAKEIHTLVDSEGKELAQRIGERILEPEPRERES